MTGSFEEYVAARWSRLVRSAVLMGADPHAAEDLVQTTLAKCYLAWSRVSRADEPDAYVHRILINTLTDTRRRRSSRETPIDRLPERVTADGAEERARGDALRRALLALPIEQRQVLVLRYYADLSESQIATVLGVAAGTVKSRASRGLAALEADPSLTELTNGATR